MNRLRTILIRGFLVFAGTVLTLTAPAAVPWALLLAVSFVANDGPLSSSPRWILGWLLFLELASASAVGTLTLPFCFTVLALASARRFISLGSWSERPGWALADSFSTSLIAVASGILAGTCWIIAGALEHAPMLPERFHLLVTAVPLFILVPPLLVMAVRVSTEPFRRPITFAVS